VVPPRFAILPVLALPFAAFACGGHDAEQLPPSVDGGGLLNAIAPVDASLADAVAVDSAEGAADSAASVADVGSPDSAPASGPVTIVVLIQGAPEPGVTIVFSDASGAIVVTATTDANGKATQVLLAGGQVTAVLGTPPYYVRNQTITAVEPGDYLTVNDFPPVAVQAEVDGLPASPPDAGPDGGAGYSMNIGGCNPGALVEALPVRIGLSPGCIAGDSFPLLVLAEAQGLPSAFTFLKGNSVLAADDAGVVHLSPSLPWSTATTTQTLSTTNNPVGPGFVTLALDEIADNVSYTTATTTTLDDAGASNGAFVTHIEYADSVQTAVSVCTLGTGGYQPLAFNAMATRGAPPAASGASSLDLSKLLPPITGTSLTSGTSASPSFVASWTSGGSLAATAGGLITVSWMQEEETASSTGPIGPSSCHRPRRA
jgi:hypothetical protein